MLKSCVPSCQRHGSAALSCTSCSRGLAVRQLVPAIQAEAAARLQSLMDELRSAFT